MTSSISFNSLFQLNIQSSIVCSFSNNYYSVMFRVYSLHNLFTESMLTFYLKFLFWNQTEIDISWCCWGIHGNKSWVSSHEFYKTNTVWGAFSLSVCSLNDLPCDFTWCFISEWSVYDWDIVIDCLWNTTHCYFKILVIDFFNEHFQGSMSTISSNCKENVDLLLFQNLSNFLRIKSSSRSPNYWASFCMNVLDDICFQFEPFFRFWESIIPPFNSINLIYSVIVLQTHEYLSNNYIQPRT